MDMHRHLPARFEHMQKHNKIGQNLEQNLQLSRHKPKVESFII